MRGRRLITAAATIVAVAAVGVPVWMAVRHDPPAADAAPDDAVERSTATVTRRDLERVEEFDGVVGHGDATALPLHGNGTLTGLPTVGDVVASGDVVAELDGETVVVLQGTRPAWRAMQSGMRDGPDVAQLESALLELGYVGADDIEVDETWTAETTAAVRTMQTWLGRPVTGRIELGDIVFHDGPMRLDTASAAGIEITGVDQIVTMSLGASDAQDFAVGDELQVELPSGEARVATIAEIGAPQTGQDGSTTVPIELTLPAAGDEIIDGTPVDVQLRAVAADGVLAVPAEALLALAEGGYALEVADDGGSRLVGVEVGDFADGWVEVVGAIDEGAEVIVP
ncbi:MAG: peptidoglycan-binding protein [Actinobacteria bacterium]|nr:peptidoglycan-binding protein [Actinomycetota bacterium]